MFHFYFISIFVVILDMIRTGKCLFGQVNLTDLSVRMTGVLKALSTALEIIIILISVEIIIIFISVEIVIILISVEILLLF